MRNSRRDDYRWRSHTGIRRTYDEMASERARVRRKRPEVGLLFLLRRRRAGCGVGALMLKRASFRDRTFGRNGRCVVRSRSWQTLDPDAWALAPNSRERREAMMLSRDWAIARSDASREDVQAATEPGVGSVQGAKGLLSCLLDERSFHRALSAA